MSFAGAGSPPGDVQANSFLPAVPVQAQTVAAIAGVERNAVHLAPAVAGEIHRAADPRAVVGPHIGFQRVSIGADYRAGNREGGQLVQVPIATSIQRGIPGTDTRQGAGGSTGG